MLKLACYTNWMTNKGITLVGMTGAGKTTIGPILGNKLSWPVYDVDSIIVKEQSKKSGQILKLSGRQTLIDLETDCIKQTESL
jgi:shikimate kinase